MATVWHTLCLRFCCGLWIEYVPSGANPADELSRAGTCYFVKDPEGIHKLLFPQWVDMGAFSSTVEVLDEIGRSF